jgi:hypothetical protein
MSWTASIYALDPLRGLAAYAAVFNRCSTSRQTPAAGTVFWITPSAPATGVTFKVQSTNYYSCFNVFGTLVSAHLGEVRSFFACLGSWLGFAFPVSGLLIFQAHWSRWHAAQELMVAVSTIPMMVAWRLRLSIENALHHLSPRCVGKISAKLFDCFVSVPGVAFNGNNSMVLRGELL